MFSYTIRRKTLQVSLLLMKKHISLKTYSDPEINMKGSGRVEYVFVGVNEEIEIKLQTQYFSNVQTRQEACSQDEDYSDLKVGWEAIHFYRLTFWSSFSVVSSASGRIWLIICSVRDLGCMKPQVSPATTLFP